MRLLVNGVILGLLALPALAQSPQPSTAPPPRAATPQAVPAPASQAAAQEKVDLNFATAEELQVLPGIGPARAAAILSHRPYRSVDEVASKASVPAAVVEGIRGRLTATQMNVNTATKREMISTLPGIGDARADAILRARPYATPEELVSKGGVPQATFERIRQAITLR